jgi:hypothetical protein
MRKLFWGWTAAGVALAGGVCGAGYYACCHPDGVVARCVRGASAVVLPAGTALPLRSDPPAAGPEAAGAVAGAAGVPSNPVPVAEPDPGPQAQPGATIEPPVDPEPIQIHEEEQAPLAAPVEGEPLPDAKPSTIDKGALQLGAIAGEAVMVPEACPMPMPFADEEYKAQPCEKAAGGEEQAEEGAGSEAGTCRECPVATLVRWMMRALKVEMPAWWTEPGPSGGATDCPGDGNPPRQCPDTTPHCAPSAPAAPGAEGPTEGAPKPLSKALRRNRLLHGGADGDACPPHFDVDTMEYRPSDACLDDYKVGEPL